MLKATRVAQNFPTQQPLETSYYYFWWGGGEQHNYILSQFMHEEQNAFQGHIVPNNIVYGLTSIKLYSVFQSLHRQTCLNIVTFNTRAN